MAKAKPLVSAPETAGFIEFRNYCIETWEDEYRAKTYWTPIEFAALKRVYRLVGDGEELKRRWSRYLDDPGAFYRGHPPRKFAADLNRWAGDKSWSR